MCPRNVNGRLASFHNRFSKNNHSNSKLEIYLQSGAASRCQSLVLVSLLPGGWRTKFSRCRGHISHTHDDEEEGLIAPVVFLRSRCSVSEQRCSAVALHDLQCLALDCKESLSNYVGC